MARGATIEGAPVHRMPRRRFLAVLGGGAVVAGATAVGIGLNSGTDSDTPKPADIDNPFSVDVSTGDNPPLPAKSERVPTIGRIVYDFHPRTSESDKNIISQTANFAKEQFESELEVVLSRDAEIRTVMEDSLSRGAFTQDHRATFYLINPEWIRSSEQNRIYAVAHELFHIFQHDTSNKIATDKVGKSWFIEGSAKVAGELVLIKMGLKTEDQVKRGRAQAAATSKIDIDRNIVIASSDYALAAVAVEVLLRDRGLKPIGDYLKLINQGKTPDEAFEIVFEESRPDFETRFMQWAKENVLKNE